MTNSINTTEINSAASTTIDQAYLYGHRQVIELSATVNHDRSWSELVELYPDLLPSMCPIFLWDIEHCYAQKSGVEQVHFVLVRGIEDHKDPSAFAKMNGLKTTNARELFACAENHANLPALLGPFPSYDRASEPRSDIKLFSTEQVTEYGLLTWLRFDLDRVYSLVNSCSNKSPWEWHLFRK